MISDFGIIAIARELMWFSDWPAHAAKSMGIDDYHMMPERIAHRLKLRDQQAKMPINQPTPKNFEALSELVGKPIEPI